jgi:hypothetical protein
MGDISKRLANTLQPAKKNIQKKSDSNGMRMHEGEKLSNQQLGKWALMRMRERHLM